GAAWCRHAMVNHRAMLMAADVRHQLAQLCKRVLGLVPEQVSAREAIRRGDTTSVRRCLARAFAGNVARYRSGATYVTINNAREAYLHPTSVLRLYKAMPACVPFHELACTSKLYMRIVSEIDDQWL